MDNIPSQIYLSVIIPSGRPEMVLATIRALIEQQYDPKSYEILVVTPFVQEASTILPPTVHIVAVDKLYPPGRMRNVGAKKARGRLLAFVDDDCIPPANWLAYMVNKIKEEKEIGVIGCRLVSFENSFMDRCADHCLFSAYQYQTNKKIALGSAAIVVKQDVFDGLGGFDEKLLASEDWDFSLRVQKSGKVCVFDAGITVLHNHRRGTLLSIIKGAYRSGYRSGLVVQKRNRGSLSRLAWFSIYFESPWLYWLLIAPYSVVLTSAQAIENLRNKPGALLFLPLFCASRCVYHIGVWRRLLHGKTTS